MPFVEHSGKQVVPLWINGAAHPLQPGRFFEVVSAAEDRVVHYAQGADEADARAAADAAAAAFPIWSQTPHNERRRILLRAADLLTERAEDLAQMQVRETSCLPAYGRFMSSLGAEALREIAAAITGALTGALPPVAGNPGLYLCRKEPLGAVLVISPWNSPAILGTRGVASALAAGCTVVLKGSEICPALYRQLVAVFEDAGVPRGALNLLFAERADAPTVTEAVVAHPAIRKVEFIGSAAVGRQIGLTAAKYIKPVLMELGGKCPVLVLRDANLPKAAQLAAFGAVVHHGQVCFSTERIIVVEEAAEEFTRLLKEEFMTKYTEGFGRAATREFAEKAHAMLEEARKNGAEYLAGDNSFLDGEKRTQLMPTLVTNVPHGARLRDSESFGPSASLYVVPDEEAAVALANDSAYGLTCAVWSEDALRAVALSRRLEFGVVHVNSSTPNDQATVPIGAVKGSGWGANNAAAGIDEFLHTKQVSVHSSGEPVVFGG